MFLTKGQDLPDTQTSRESLRKLDNVRFVDRVEYCNLLVSSRILQRCDIPNARVRGVYDPELGLQYLIEEERLFPRVAVV